MDHYLTALQGHFTPAGKATLEQLQQALTWNNSLIQQYGPSCYNLGEESSCQAKVSQYLSEAKKVDQTVIDYYKNTVFRSLTMDSTAYPIGSPEENRYVTYAYSTFVSGITTFTIQANNHLIIHSDYIGPVTRQHRILSGDLVKTGDHYQGDVVIHDVIGGGTSHMLGSFMIIPSDI